MSQELRSRVFAELDSLTLIDPHTHINALDPASHDLADILGYHYYTELAHSAGLSKDQIEDPSITPKEKVSRLIAHFGPIENTIQYSWFVEMAKAFFGFDGDRITNENWESVYEAARGKYIIDAKVMDILPESSRIMHPLPRVDEITREVDADPRAAYFRQAHNGLYIRMALLRMVLEA